MWTSDLRLCHITLHLLVALEPSSLPEFFRALLWGSHKAENHDMQNMPQGKTSAGAKGHGAGGFTVTALTLSCFQNCCHDYTNPVKGQPFLHLSTADTSSLNIRPREIPKQNPSSPDTMTAINIFWTHFHFWQTPSFSCPLLCRRAYTGTKSPSISQ